MADGVREGQQRIVVKLLARLVAVRVDVPDRELHHAVPGDGGRRGGGGFDGFNDLFHVGQDGAQPPAQTHFLSHL